MFDILILSHGGECRKVFMSRKDRVPPRFDDKGKLDLSELLLSLR